MILILPLRDKEILQKLNQQSGCNAAHAFCYYDADEITGYVLYNIVDLKGQIVYASYNSSVQLDGMIRAVLGSLLQFNIDSVSFENTNDYEALTKLSFITNSSNVLNNINDFLSGCKNCKK